MTPMFRHTLMIRFNECDPQGVVFNANYLVYLDVAVTQLVRSVYGSYAQMIAAGTDLMLVESRLTYRTPARAEEMLDVTLTPSRVGTTSLRLGGELAVDGATVATAELSYVAVTPGTASKQRVPEPLREALCAAVVTDGDDGRERA